MDNFVGARRDDVFLNQHLDPVRHRLKQTKRADTIGSIAILDAPENFSLQDGDQRKECQKYCEHCGDVDERGDDLHHPIGRTGKGRK